MQMQCIIIKIFKKAYVCTLVKMMTIMDAPLVETMLVDG